MDDPGNFHDHFFREIAKDPVAASGLLENFLPPDVRAMVDMDSIELQKDSFVEPDLRAYYSDLLFRVRLAEAVGYVYFLIEHKSHPDRFVHLQVLNYIKPVWGMRKGEALPLVIPVVVYHGERNWPYDPRFSGVFPPNPPELARFFPDFEIVLADLSRYSDADIRGAVLTRAFLLVLKHARSPGFPDRMPGIFRLLGELRRSRTGLGHLEAICCGIWPAWPKTSRRNPWKRWWTNTFRRRKEEKLWRRWRSSGKKEGFKREFKKAKLRGPAKAFKTPSKTASKPNSVPKVWRSCLEFEK